jgi:hypothetical protein
MATYRVGIGSFNLKDGAVGIGTESSGLGNLKVEGTIKTANLDVTGVSTFQRYAGFAADDLNINRDTSLSSEHSTIGDIVVGLNSTFTVSTGATVTVGTVESVSIGTHFSPPTGGVEDRPEVPVEGTVRFNTELNTLEFYDGVDWRQFTVNNSGGSGRGVWGGGATPTYYTFQDYITISSLGNAQFFGDLTVARGFLRGVASSVRGVTGGGEGSPARTDTMEYFTIQSAGNAIDFGNLSAVRGMLGSTSSSTRGVWGGGEQPGTNVNIIEYIEINTIGNAVDFGDLTKVRKDLHSGLVNSPTRGIFAGGSSPDSLIDVITIAAKGNSIKFGDLSVARKGLAGCSNSTRGVFVCGEAHGSPGTVTTLDYITIASDGNAQDFGDAMSSRYIINGGVSNETRGVWSGGATALNLIEYINFSTLGDAMDFGDLGLGRRGASGVSNSHGGLGGY